jgi:hypothetical protein
MFALFYTRKKKMNIIIFLYFVRRPNLTQSHSTSNSVDIFKVFLFKAKQRGFINHSLNMETKKF